MAQNKKRKPAQQQATPIKPENYIRERARKLPIHECLMGDSSGLTIINISRQRANGNLIFGFFLVDTGCLGVKNCGWFFNITPEQYQVFLQKQSHTTKVEPCAPMLAFNIIYGAVEYAETLGFKPHRDYKIAEYLLDETVEYMELEFGKNGKPLFVNGPYDNIKAVLNTLDRTVGKGNYEYIAMLGNLEDEYGVDEHENDYDEEEDEEDDLPTR